MPPGGNMMGGGGPGGPMGGPGGPKGGGGGSSIEMMIAGSKVGLIIGNFIQYDQNSCDFAFSQSRCLIIHIYLPLDFRKGR